MIYKIALRSILRHKRRTILSAITIAVGLMVFIAMNSLMSGMDRGAIDNMVHLSTGAVKLTTKTYEEDKQTYPLAYGIENRAEIEAVLQQDRRVTGVTRRTQFLGQLSNYAETMPVIGTVIDPQADGAVFDLRPNIEGAFFSKQSEREIILGGQLARDLGVKVGDYITLYALTRYESRNADEFLITGLLNTTDPGLNSSGVFLTYAAADEFLDLEGLVTEIDVAVAKRAALKSFMADVKALDSELAGRFPQLSAASFLELGAGYFEVSKAKSGFGMIFMLIILLIAGVGIFNTVFMSVYERIREIGVLRAHGMVPRDINLLFVLEGVITGLLGSSLGVMLGVLINLYLAIKGYPLDKVMDASDIGGMPVWGTIYGTWNVEAIVAVFVFGVLIATLASIIPALRAARMQVTTALRFN